MSASVLAATFFVVSFSIGFNNGTFNGYPVPIILLTAGFFVYALAFFFPRSYPHKPGIGSIAPSLFIVSYVTSTFFLGGWWSRSAKLFEIIQWLCALGTIPVLLLAIGHHQKRVVAGLFVSLLVLAFSLRILMLHVSPGPPIDVFVILQEAPKKFLAGVNPYTSMYTPVFPGITPDYFAYWPAAFLSQIPFVTLFSDPRVLLVLADIAAALVIYTLSDRSKTGMLLSLTYLFRPLSLYMIEGSWLTSLDTFWFAAAVYLMAKKKIDSGAIGVALAILTGIQFFFSLLVPFAAKALSWNKKYFFAFFGILSIIVLPFIVLDPQKFFDSTIWVYFQSPPHPSILIHTSLSLNSLIFAYTKTDIPSLLLYVPIVFIAISTFIKQQKNALGFASGISLIFFATFIFGRQAFANYYYMVASFILISMACLAREENSQITNNK